MARIAAELFGPAGLTARQTSFDRRDAIQALTEVLPTGLAVTGRELEAAADKLLAERDAVPLLLTTGRQAGARWSTAELLETERAALTRADLPSAVRCPNADVLEAVLSTARISDEQRQAVRGLLTSAASVDVLVGPAGSGKTAALRTAAKGWADIGAPVVGVALAAVTARRLEAATDIFSRSLARLLADLARPNQAGLPPGAVVVLDEASMVGTRQLAALLKHATEAGGKLVLVGDPAQLPEIEAGGLFAALARRENTLVLAGNQRQTHDWERHALAQLRAGNLLPALDAYLAHDRVHTHMDAETTRASIAEHYLAAVQRAASPYEVAVLATRSSDVLALNELVRARLQAIGQLAPDALTANTADGPRGFAIGDLVLVTRNDHERGVFNGTRATVTGVGDDISLRTEEGNLVELPVSAAADQLTHAYAMTVHKAQGLTVETCLLYGAGALCQQAGYVALSRGRVANHVHTALSALSEDAAVDVPPAFQPMGGPDPAEVLDLLAQRLADRREHQLASEQAPDWTHTAGLTRDRVDDVGISL